MVNQSLPANLWSVKEEPSLAGSRKFLEFRMIAGPIIALLALIGLVAIFVWMVDWASGSGGRRRSAFDILDERFARGEIDKTEYEEKRKLIGDKIRTG